MTIELAPRGGGTRPTRASAPRRSGRSHREPVRLAAPTVPSGLTPTRGATPTRSATLQRPSTPSRSTPSRRAASLPTATHMSKRGGLRSASARPARRTASTPTRTSARKAAARNVSEKAATPAKRTPASTRGKKVVSRGSKAAPKAKAQTAKRTSASGKALGRSKSKTIARARPVKKKKKNIDVDEARALIGKRISIFWPEDCVYYNAMVLAFDEKRGEHKIYYYPTDASGEQVEVVDLYDNSRQWKPVQDQPPMGEHGPEDPFALVGSRISVEWPDRHLGDRKMHRCEAIVVKYNLENSYRVVYTQDDYCEDRDLSAANDLPWQIAPEPAAHLDRDDPMRPREESGGPMDDEPGDRAPTVEDVTRIGDITSSFDKSLERQLEFEAPLALPQPSHPVQLAPLLHQSHAGHQSSLHGVDAPEGMHPIEPQSPAQPTHEPSGSPVRRRMIPSMPRFG